MPRSVRLAEAPSFGKPVILYDIRSKGAEAYLDLAKEVMAHGQLSLFASRDERPAPPKRKALGKGLSALLPDRRADAAALGATTEVPVGQPRAQSPPAPEPSWTPARSPSSRRRSGRAGWSSPSSCGGPASGYQIIAGERRWRAAQQALGLATVPVVVREVPDDRLLELALDREHPARRAQPARGGAGLPAPPAGAGADPGGGRDAGGPGPPHRRQRAAPAAPDPRRRASSWRRARLDAGHARALLALERAEDQVALAREAARKGLSVREVERRVAQLRAPRARKESAHGPEHPGRGGAAARRPRGPGRDPAPRARRGPADRLRQRGGAQPALRASPARRPRPVAGVVS